MSHVSKTGREKLYIIYNVAIMHKELLVLSTSTGISCLVALVVIRKLRDTCVLLLYLYEGKCCTKIVLTLFVFCNFVCFKMLI